MSAVIEQIATLVGKRPRFDRRPAHPADVPATWANIAKANRLLGWSPQVSIEEGLQRSVAWYRENQALALSLDLGD
jgi:nucleoside-diphosphate-sugar epimerase